MQKTNSSKWHESFMTTLGSNMVQKTITFRQEENFQNKHK